MNNSLFDYIARDDDTPIINGRKALSLANKRIEERFGNFLAKSSNTDSKQRFELIRDDFDAVVASVCEEVGYEDSAGLTRTLWNDRISRVSGKNPFAKKCDCKDDEECSKCKDSEEKNSRTASVHEARKPKLCPYHSEVMDISLAQGEAQAGFNAMNSHAWGPKHCKGDEYDGHKCNFKPEMVTQSFWDNKAEKAEQRRNERAEQAEQIEQTQEVSEPSAESEFSEETSEPGLEPSTESEDSVADGGEESGLPSEELMAVAASAKRFVPLVHVAEDPYADDYVPEGERPVDCGRCGEENIKPGEECPVCGYTGGNKSDPAWDDDERFHSKVKTTEKSPETQSGIAGMVESVINQGMSYENAIRHVAERQGVSVEEVEGLVQEHGGAAYQNQPRYRDAGTRESNPTPPRSVQDVIDTYKRMKSTFGDRDKALEYMKSNFPESMEAIRLYEEREEIKHEPHTAEALEHQDIAKNTFPKTDRSTGRPDGPPDTEMKGSPHPTEQVDIFPGLDEPSKFPKNEDPKMIGENVTERQDVTEDSKFDNKYPNRWASVDDAISNFRS